MTAPTISAKRFLLAGFLAALASLVYVYLIWDVLKLFGPLFDNMPQMLVEETQTQSGLWYAGASIIIEFLIAFFYTAIYAISRQGMGKGVGQSVLLAFFIGVLVQVPYRLSNMIWMLYPANLSVVLMLDGIVKFIIIGAVVGKIYREVHIEPEANVQGEQ